MATKDHGVPFKYKHGHVITDTSNSQYSNLNLNQDQKCSDIFPVRLKSGATSDSRENFQEYDFKATDEVKKGSNLWNKKSSKHLSTNFLDLKHDSEEKNEIKKTSNLNNSTLSLHITAYENSFLEASSNNNDDEREDFKNKSERKDLVKKWEIIKDFFAASSSIIQNPFEFPRQQESEEETPEIAQFKASQKLFNPNQMDANFQSPPLLQPFNDLLPPSEVKVEMSTANSDEVIHVKKYKYSEESETSSCSSSSFETSDEEEIKSPEYEVMFERDNREYTGIYSTDDEENESDNERMCKERLISDDIGDDEEEEEGEIDEEMQSHHLSTNYLNLNDENLQYDDEDETESLPDSLESLHVEEPVNHFCRIDDDGVLHFEAIAKGYQGYDCEKIKSESILAYNSEWRLLVQISKWGQFGLYVEAESRGGLDTFYQRYPCYVEVSAYKANGTSLVCRDLFHVFDGKTDYGFNNLGVIPMHDPIRIFRASVKIFGSAPSGLFNSTTLCYMNVILQSLFALTEFRRLILKANVENECVQSLQKLFLSMQFGSSPGDSSAVFFATKWAKQENSFLQQDIQEFLTCFLDELEICLQPIGLDDEVRRLFRGNTINYTHAPDYDYKSETEDNFYNIQLNMLSPDEKIVHSMDVTLKQYVRRQLMDGDDCLEIPGHGKKPGYIGYRFSHLPPILNFYLMRSKFDPVRGMVKITEKFHFPKILDMNEYMTSEDDKKEDYTYLLQSIITHKGNGSSGHYTCYVNNKPTVSDMWYSFDDKDVEVHHEKALFGEGDEFFCRFNSTPCMFFYIRKSMAEELTSPPPTLYNISPTLMPQMEPYIIKLLFWHFNPDLVSTEHHIRLTTKDIFDISQDWLYTQAVDLFDLQLDEFHLWAYDRLANIFTLPNYVVNCSNKRKIAELPIYNNTLEIYVKKHVD